MTVREALNQKRKQLRGRVEVLHLCKGELFYGVKDAAGKVRHAGGTDDTVYPVSPAVAALEAAG
jgi:hypothetical protein